MKKNNKDLIKDLGQGRIAPVYLFLGDEDFLVETALNELKRLLITKGFEDFDYDLCYGGEFDFSEILKKLLSPPLGSKRRLVVIKNIKRLSVSERQALLDYLKSPNPSVCLVIVAGRELASDKLISAISNQTTTVNFYPLRDYEIPPEIVALARKKGLFLEPGAVELLQELVGNSLANLNSELDKLKIFIGEESKVSQELIATVSGNSRAYQVYDLSQTIGGRNRKRALEILHRLSEWNEEPTWIVTAVAREFFDLFLIKTMLKEHKTYEEIGRFFGRKPPGVIDQMTLRSKRWKRAEIIMRLRQLKTIDTQIKQGKDPFFLLESFITEGV